MGDLWTYRDYEWGSSTTDIAGYRVQAIDGEIGNVDQATYEVGASYIVVDCGPWILGKKAVLPAALIERVDLADERVYINRTKEQICDAPEFDEARYRGVAYRIELEEHYGEGGPGYRAHDSPLADPLLRQ
jgi:hypothetical protein